MQKYFRAFKNCNIWNHELDFDINFNNGDILVAIQEIQLDFSTDNRYLISDILRDSETIHLEGISISEDTLSNFTEDITIQFIRTMSFKILDI